MSPAIMFGSKEAPRQGVVPEKHSLNVGKLDLYRKAARLTRLKIDSFGLQMSYQDLAEGEQPYYRIIGGVEAEGAFFDNLEKVRETTNQV